jgi:hypothetical protein
MKVLERCGVDSSCLASYFEDTVFPEYNQILGHEGNEEDMEVDGGEEMDERGTAFMNKLSGAVSVLREASLLTIKWVSPPRLQCILLSCSP